MEMNDRINYTNVINKTFEKLEGKEVTAKNLRNIFKNNPNDYSTLKIFVAIYATGIFKSYRDQLDPKHIQIVMEFRREFYFENPSDGEELEDLLEYFESIEDYETCIKLNSIKTVV